MKKRKTYSREFKLNLLAELNTKSTLEVCRENNLHPSTVSRWKKEFKQNPNKAFSGNGNIWKLEAELDKYKRLVGELYKDNEFLKKTLRKLYEIKDEEEKMRCIK